MTLRANPGFLEELQKYGELNIEDCFNCGNCTAICPLANENTSFPRRDIRMVQLGLSGSLLESIDPWLCYYCGECTETCPREAEPAEAQMVMRRWLTAQYDWTGLAGKFYTSKVWEIGSLLFVAAVIILLFALFHGPVVTDSVELNTFAPVHAVEIGDWIMLAVLSFFLLSNVLRMYIFTVHRSGIKVPLRLFITEAWELIYQAATQIQFSKCDEDEGTKVWDKVRWRNHLILVGGYVLMFGMIVLLLPWFQTDNIYPIWHPQRWLGYIATIMLLYGAGYAIWGRIKKDYEYHRYSHLSDWIFPILLFATALSGILVHIFRYMGLPLATYYTYVIHLAILTPMLVLEVPFGKWSHLAYRPFAIYFETLKEKAREQQSISGAVAVGTD